jgi:hypothetical protein
MRRLANRRKREGGFALLVVFLLAAAVAFTLYQEMPRAAFESARDKEQLLIDRGNQYKRAIEVFYAVNKRYPTELKDLENTNEKRYLRHRYKDPMTGSDQWRLIHTNGTMLTDSLVQKPPAQNAANGTPANGALVGGGPLGANNLNSAPATDAAATDPTTGLPIPPSVNPAAQRRPSDRGFSPGLAQAAGGGAPGAVPFGANPNGLNSPPYDPSDPRTWPAITLTPPGSTTPGAPGGQPIPIGGAPPGGAPLGSPSPGQPPGTQIIPGAIQNGIPGQLPGQGGANPQPATFDPANPAGLNPSGLNQAGLNQAGSPAATAPPSNPLPTTPFSQPGATPAPAQPPAQPQITIPSQPQAPLQAQPGAQPQAGAQPTVGAGGSNTATQFINNQLFSPSTGSAAPGATPSAGPGLAGVASQFKGTSIKSYQKRTKYQEWEFVFDPAAKASATAPPGTSNPNQANPNQPGQAPGLGLQGAPGQAGAPSPFGQNPFGQGGQTTGGQTTGGQTPGPASGQTNGPAAAPFP